jgi:cell wall-associated NlpC family hydrolase
MRYARIVWLSLGLLIQFPAFARADEPDPTASASAPALSSNDDGRVASLDSGDIEDFDAQPAAVRKLLTASLALTKLNLTYKYGSDDPRNGGMDCSGTILNEAGLKDVPRDSVGQYRWVWESGSLHAVVGVKEDTFELEKLRPGDLLFWTGTYAIDRDPNVTHVMIYLGINRLTGKRVMVGASDGRTFNGKQRFGVSVFDFVLPRPTNGGENTSRFVGYGPAPGL